MLLRALSGDSIVFTSVKIGNGAMQTAATATDLSNPLLALTINSVQVNSNNATLSTRFNNASVTAGFRCTEVGIFVQDQDDSTSELLYAYGTQEEATADYIASSADSILETEMDFSIFISEAQNVSALINESMVYASKTEFEAHISNTNNPHNVSKEQINLGNVPNVKTNDQTPTYLTSASLTNLSSGEKLSVAFGKIAKSVSALIAHLVNKSNPHNVTAVQAGAAPKSHLHSATDITSGTFSVARGGTGKSNWSANRLMYPTASSIFDQIPFPEANGAVLKGNRTGAPFWGMTSESGIYTGTGKGSADTPNVLQFHNGCPHLILIKQVDVPNRWGILFPFAHTGFSDVDGVKGSLAVEVATINGMDVNVSWYFDDGGSAMHPANQLDHTGRTFSYVGIM